MEKDVIVMVGAGAGGRAILSNLLAIPGVYIKWVCDINPEAPGILLAKENNIDCCLGNWEEIISNDPEIDLIFEVTGKQEVLNKLHRIKPPNAILIGAGGTKIIFHLLESQHKIHKKLEAYKQGLELQIIQRTEELEQANRELELRILEYERLNEKLQQINNEKTKYLLRSTHQLKAPFAAIQSYVDIILQGYTGEIPQKTRDILEKIKERCEMLSNSIKDMLELANLKSAIRDNISMKDISIAEILRKVISEASILAEDKGIKLTLVIHSDAENVKVRCNPQQLTILFSIFVDNAIKYSNSGTEVKVECEPEKNKLAVSVSDQGIGIPHEHINNIFNEFFRTNEAVKQHANGTGLGLAIAREIANIHRFDIHVDSTPGKGTTFTILIPVKTNISER